VAMDTMCLCFVEPHWAPGAIGPIQASASNIFEWWAGLSRLTADLVGFHESLHCCRNTA